MIGTKRRVGKTGLHIVNRLRRINEQDEKVVTQRSENLAPRREFAG